MYLETNDSTWHSDLDLSLVSGMLFKKKFPPSPSIKSKVASLVTNPYCEYKGCELLNKRVYSNVFASRGQGTTRSSDHAIAAHSWLTIEAYLPPPDASACNGHFYEEGSEALPHSVMLFHNSNLVGDALSELTGLDIPFRNNDFFSSDEVHGIKLLNWKCVPENLHFANTYGLHFQVKVYLSRGTMASQGSMYTVECMAKQEVTGLICYKATGSFILNPLQYVKTEFSAAIAQYLESGSTKDLDTLWKILDINGDGTISPEELKQYIVESDMKSITSQEFDILYDAVDEDSNGEITYEEFTAFFCHLHESSFQDFA